MWTPDDCSSHARLPIVGAMTIAATSVGGFCGNARYLSSKLFEDFV